MRTINELKDRQSWSLFQKIDHTVGVISQFHTRMNKQIYVSFSGGKDSTVLLDIVRRFVDKNILAVFCNTGNEYPEIVRFARSIENVTVIRPRLTIKKVIEKYGFPLISKEQALYIRQARHTKSVFLRSLRTIPQIGKNGRPRQGVISKKWQFLIKAPFDVSEKCCHFLKKTPFHKFNRESGLYPIIGTMAQESRLRLQKWLNEGCNSFDSKNIASYPLSIWREADIWEYIRYFKIPYCPVYDKGEKRTGYMFCGFGCQFAGDNRFYRLKKNWPRLYDYFMNLTNNGVTFRQALQICGIDFPEGINRQLKLEF